MKASAVPGNETRPATAPALQLQGADKRLNVAGGVMQFNGEPSWLVEKEAAARTP